MSSPYVPTAWLTGDVITQAKANNWETQYADVFDSGAKTFAGAVTGSGGVSDGAGSLALVRAGASTISGLTTADVVVATSSAQLGRSARLPAANFPALTGDVTTSAGSLATTLAASGVAAATYGSASLVPVLTIDAKGRVTSASTAAIGAIQAYRGLSLRTHPDNDIALKTVFLEHADEIVLDDGSVLGPWDTLSADITASGAGGLDTGTEQASTWYEVYAIAKADGTKNLLLHRSKDNLNDQSNLFAGASARMLRLATGTATDQLAQGIKFATSGPLAYVDLALRANGTPTGNVWVSIQASSSSHADGTPLATSDKINVALLPTLGAWVIRLVFRTPFSVVATTQYHLVLEGDYTRSDANNVEWEGDPSNRYANGIAQQYNGAAWSVATGVADFAFYGAYVTRNDTAVTMPAGYTKKAKIGYAYNNSGSDLAAYIQQGHAVTPLAPRSIGTLTPYNAVASVFFDLSALIPPGPIRARTSWQYASGGSATVAPVPDGYNYAAMLNAPFRTAGGTGIDSSSNPALNANVSANLHDILTITQALYAVADGGTLYLMSWEWQ